MEIPPVRNLIHRRFFKPDIIDLGFMKEAILYLQDGTIFRGRTLKQTGETIGEAVFNTALTGYQEV